MIRVSDETLDGFIALRRKALNREYGSRRLEDLGRFEAALARALPRMEGALRAMGRERDAEACASVCAGGPAEDERLSRGRRTFLGLCPRWRRHCPRAGESVRAPGLFRGAGPGGSMRYGACLSEGCLAFAGPGGAWL